MDLVLVILAAVAGIALGVWLGLKLGERIRDERPWKYWALNLAAVVVSILALVAVGFIRQLWAWSAVLGTFAGALTGLKYGYGQSVGLWRTHDRIMRSDKDLRD